MITLEELEQIEDIFMNRISNQFVKQGENMLNKPCARTMCYLWSRLDKMSYVHNLDELFIDPVNICRYIAMYASNPIVLTGPKERTWVFSNEYQSFLSDARISETLEQLLKSQEFFKLTKSLQTTMAAYKVWTSKKKSNIDQVSEKDINEQMKNWKNRYINDIQ